MVVPVVFVIGTSAADAPVECIEAINKTVKMTAMSVLESFFFAFPFCCVIFVLQSFVSLCFSACERNRTGIITGKPPSEVVLITGLRERFVRRLRFLEPNFARIPLLHSVLCFVLLYQR